MIATKFMGAMGKSAQMPLHVWLPDSMEGPTPISALIHAATMVTAGIFMVARMSPLFELSDTALSFVLVIGATTALFMGFLGIVANDIKRVIAYSTLSQLGYMTVALGASAYAGAIFHLMTHAFFKALLFLAAGSVIIAMHHEQDMRNMGGLRKLMPWTYLSMLLATIAIAGIFPFSGFFSKDGILLALFSHADPVYRLFWGIGVLTALLTAVYTFRLVYLVFAGEPRGDSHPHQLPLLMRWPLWPLALLGLLGGLLNLPALFGGSEWLTRRLGPLAGREITAAHGTEWALAALATGLVLLGWGFARWRWGRGRDVEENRLGHFLLGELPIIPAAYQTPGSPSSGRAMLRSPRMPS